MTIYNVYGYHTHLYTFMGTIQKSFKTFQLTGGQVSPNIKTKLNALDDTFRIFINTIYCNKKLFLRLTYISYARYQPTEEDLKEFENYIDFLHSLIKKDLL